MFFRLLRVGTAHGWERARGITKKNTRSRIGLAQPGHGDLRLRFGNLRMRTFLLRRCGRRRNGFLRHGFNRKLATRLRRNNRRTRSRKMHGTRGISLIQSCFHPVVNTVKQRLFVHKTDFDFRGMHIDVDRLRSNRKVKHTGG